MPKGELVDEMATLKAKLKRKGINDLLVFVELSKYLPFWSTSKHDYVDPSDDEVSVSKEIQGLAKALGANLFDLRPFVLHYL